MTEFALVYTFMHASYNVPIFFIFILVALRNNTWLEPSNIWVPGLWVNTDPRTEQIHRWGYAPYQGQSTFH